MNFHYGLSNGQLEIKREQKQPEGEEEQQQHEGKREQAQHEGKEDRSSVKKKESQHSIKENGNKPGLKEKFIKVAAELFSTSGTIRCKTLSVATGVFIGLSPVRGFQTVTAIAASYLFRLNKILTIGFSAISLPPLIPLSIYGSYKLGGVILGNRAIDIDYNSIKDFKEITTGVLQFVTGSLVMALIVSSVAGLTTYLILRWRERKRKSKTEHCCHMN